MPTALLTGLEATIELLSTGGLICTYWVSLNDGTVFLTSVEWLLSVKSTINALSEEFPREGFEFDILCTVFGSGILFSLLKEERTASASILFSRSIVGFKF